MHPLIIEQAVDQTLDSYLYGYGGYGYGLVMVWLWCGADPRRFGDGQQAYWEQVS